MQAIGATVEQPSQPADAAAAPTSSSAKRRHRVWVSDPAAFRSDGIGAIRHDFHEHPLMQLPRLAELARELMPTGQCRFLRPGTRQDSPFEHAPDTDDGRGIDEVFARIEETGSWIALYNVQTSPAYRAFLDEVMAAAGPLVAGQQGRLYDVGGFIFISAPPSVTPFHIDRENNFWLQIAGQKTMSVWDHRDREAVPAANVERFILDGSLEGVTLRPEIRDHAHDFVVGPGDGVYFPSTSPHMTSTETSWVRPGNAVSISIGVVFYSDLTRRHRRIFRTNHFLRSIGIEPRMPGASRAGDLVKEACGFAMNALRALRL